MLQDMKKNIPDILISKLVHEGSLTDDNLF